MNTHADFLIPGSSIYYSLLYCDQQSRYLISALHAFYEAIREISFKCQDVKTAQLKYQWWREEIDRCKNKAAQHPVTQILQQNSSLTDNLNIIINTFEKDKKLSLYEDEISLINFYQNTAGLLEKTICQIMGIQDEKILKSAENMGIFIQKILHIQELRAAVLRGKIYFSGEKLLLHRVNLYEFSQLKLTENIRKLLRAEIQKIKGLPSFPRKRESRFFRGSLDSRFRGNDGALPTLIRFNIYKALLKEIEQADFPVFTQRIGLTPLRKWWIAWKTK